MIFVDPSADFDSQKAALLQVMRAKGCKDAPVLKKNAATYLDLLSFLYLHGKTFDCDPDYLGALLAVFPDSVLVQHGIYMGKTLESLTNPTWIINSTIDTIYINQASGPQHPGLQVVSGSQVGKVVISCEVTVKDLVIASGATVGDLDVEVGSTLEMLILKSCNNSSGSLQKMTRSSPVTDLSMDAGATFGLLYCKDPEELTPIEGTLN